MPNYEIERRWLVTKMGISIPQLRSLASNIIEIEQGYFGVSNPNDSLRVRIKNNNSAEVTTKRGSGIKRIETPPKDRKVILGLGREMMQISRNQLPKTRYEIDGMWELDVCHTPLEGVIILEIEKKTDTQSIEGEIQLPGFVEEVIEVTDTLTSSRLARLATELRDLNLPAMPFVLELLHPIPRIGLAGDPGSGKTGVIKILKKEFPEIHFVPEAAKILIDDLGVPTTRDPVQNRRYQKAVYEIVKTFRTLATRHAVTHKKLGIVFDRAEADGAGYFDGGIKEFETFLGTSIDEEFRKIDIAIYMEIPPKDIYEEHRAKNPYRTETYEQAVARGERTRAVWIQHPNCHLIGNEGGWDAKVNRVRQLIKLAIKH